MEISIDHLEPGAEVIRKNRCTIVSWRVERISGFAACYNYVISCTYGGADGESIAVCKQPD